MTATASPLPLDDYVGDLARRHSSAARRRTSGPTGAQLKRRLDARLARLAERAAALPVTIHSQLIGLNWLDENQHILHEAIAQIGGNLPRGYVRKLPAVEGVEDTPELRIRILAEAIVEYGVLPLDVAWIEHFLRTYQAEVPLTLGELWALPTYLRIVVLNVFCDALDEGLELAKSGAKKTRETEIAGTLSGAILSLRTIAASDWRRFVEHQSTVERF